MCSKPEKARLQIDLKYGLGSHKYIVFKFPKIVIKSPEKLYVLIFQIISWVTFSPAT